MADLFALALTLAIEWPLLAVLTHRGLRHTALLCLAMNGTTWGTAMALRQVWPLPLLPLEAAIILAESLILVTCNRLPPGRALLWSLLLNFASWQLGSPLWRHFLKS